MSTQNKEIEAGYDSTPYPGFPYENTRPENLEAISNLFSLQTPKLAKARILELGCGDGANMIPFADRFPDSYSLGVDLSKIHIDKGQKIVNELGLKNIELKHMSITDLDESYGKFDYIICHGVYSWVPDFVQESIFDICQKLLVKNGVALVSYNTLPGWNMKNTIRDLMRYHAKSFVSVGDKLSQCKALLQFIYESFEGNTTSYAQYIRSLIKSIMDQSDSYILHEYIEDYNDPIYFNQFIEKINKHDLEYLGESYISTMSIYHLPKKTQEELSKVNDVQKSTQYIDFIKNTEFKSSIITHKGNIISRQITPEKLEQFYYYSVIKPNNTEVNINDNSSVEYVSNSGTIKVSKPVMKALFSVLLFNSANPLLLKEIVIEVSKLLPSLSEESVKSVILQDLPLMVISSIVDFVKTKTNNVNIISDKPKVSRLVLQQSKSQLVSQNSVWVTGALNNIVVIQSFQLMVIQHCDGNHTIDQLNAIVFNALKDGKISINQNDKVVKDIKILEQSAKNIVLDTLKIMRQGFVLVA